MISSKATSSKAAIAALAASSVLALCSCGGSSDSTSSKAAPSGSVSSTAAAPASATATPAAGASTAEAGISDATLPTGEVLAATVATLIIPTTTPTQRAAQVIGGEDLVPTLTKLDAYLKDFKVVFKVSGQVLTGQTLKGNVQIISNGKPFPKLYPSFWQQKGSEWELTRSGACSLIAVSGITCPDAATS